MPRSLVLLATFATAVVAVDLVHRAVAVAARADELLLHGRSVGYAAGVMVAAAAWCLALLALRSTGSAVVGGLVLGGAVANVLSLALWPALDGIPNPFFVGDTDAGIAFNLADLAVVGAVFLGLPCALTLFVLRNRGRLREPVRLLG